MVFSLTTFASAKAESGDIMSALGIDVQLLVVQAIAFLLLAWALGKWVFPIFFRIVDKRQALIDEGNRAAVEAAKQAASAQDETEKLLKKARQEARDIVATAKDEAAQMVEQATAKGKAQADHIVAEAHDQLQKEVLAATKKLHNDTIDLVMQATGKVLEGVVDAKVDKSVVERALKEAK